MNQFVPDWNTTTTTTNMGGDAAFTPLGEDDGLIELLWCNGHVVMQSQPPRKPPRPEKTTPPPATAAAEDETAAWFQYPADDALEKDLFSELFGEMMAAAAAAPSKIMPPPPWTPAARGKKKAVDQFGGGGGDVIIDDDVSEVDGEAKVAAAPATAAAAAESSMLTIGSSICGSNAAPPPPPPFAAKAEPHDAAGAGGKRKQRDAAAAMDSGSPSEEVEFESAAVACEPAAKTTTAKRRRAAEVHNLSERRRRDRINEKMKALQELIPHCNKTDKASMLDEAIEYLKSLQLQLQMMWMGGGMATPVMFPAAGVHQYMQRMSAAVGMGPPHMASLPRMPPFMAPPATVQSSPVSHIPAVTMADPYARCLAVDHLQPPSPMQHYLQGMSFYQLAAAKNLQQQQQNMAAAASPGGFTPVVAAPALTPDNILHKKYDNCTKPESKGGTS